MWSHTILRVNSTLMARAGACRYLNFEGADAPMDGPYATSIPLMHAMDPTNDVMLAFGMNGRVLHPDHGYVRLLRFPLCVLYYAKLRSVRSRCGASYP